VPLRIDRPFRQRFCRLRSLYKFRQRLQFDKVKFLITQMCLPVSESSYG
jgi:hypothetical protein